MSASDSGGVKPSLTVEPHPDPYLAPASLTLKGEANGPVGVAKSVRCGVDDEPLGSAAVGADDAWALDIQLEQGQWLIRCDLVWEEQVGASAEVSVTVVTAASPTVKITPEEPTTSDELQAVVTGQGTLQWSANGTPQPAWSDAVPPSATTKGQTWKLTVTGATGLKASASVLIVDSPPSPGSVALQPALPTILDTVTCLSDVEPTDPDADPLTTTYAWYLDDEPLLVFNGPTVNLGSTATATGKLPKAGRKLRCVRIVTADGLSAKATSSVATLADAKACEVEPSPCAKLALCQENGTPKPMCICKAGYSGDGQTCVDVDECATNNGGCAAEATCSNEVGAAPTCTCKAGWTGDGKVCAPSPCSVNNGGCPTSAQCVYAPSTGVECACTKGYAPTSGGGCKDLAPTITLSGSKQEVIAQFQLWTEPGFVATDAVDGDISADVNIAGTVNAHAPGTYVLTYTVKDSAQNSVSVSRQVLVKDVDECALKPSEAHAAQCMSGATCVNTKGSYTCSCGSTPPNGAFGCKVTTAVLSTRNGHTCAVRSNGKMACWGDNSHGQVGKPPCAVNDDLSKCTPNIVCDKDDFPYKCNSEYSPKVFSPLLVPIAGNVVAASAGKRHTCAVTSDGALACWGDASSGQLGIMTKQAMHASPQWVSSFGAGKSQVQAVAVGAGAQHTCAVTSEGTLWCWGDNNHGQLGVGDYISVDEPVNVPGLKGVIEVALGQEHTCALLQSGQVYCWGRNQHGQLGASGSTQPNPTLVTAFKGATQLVSGDQHNCVLLAGGEVRCWGGNAFNQLGDTSTIDKATPSVPQNLGPMATVTAGEVSSCAVNTAGAVYCWGADVNGEVSGANGAKATNAYNTPTLLPKLPKASSVAFGRRHGCVVDKQGDTLCWGHNGLGNLGIGASDKIPAGQQVTGLKDVKAVGAGESHACAVTKAGVVRCWGYNAYGQLGDGTIEAIKLQPSYVQLPAKAESVTAGRLHSCALVNGGKVLCWGRNEEGQLGPGSSALLSTTAVEVSSLPPSTDFDAGGMFTCAVTSVGAVFCWGSSSPGNFPGSFVAVKAPTPTAVKGLGAATKVSVGFGHACALLKDQSVACWGFNFFGQLGDGTSVSTAVPVKVKFTGKATDLGVGDYHTCALVNGKVGCVGANFSGQQGLGKTTMVDDSWTLASLGNASTVSAGADHTCALDASGQLYCWGFNANGQVGDGGLAFAVPSPAKVGPQGSFTSVAPGDAITCAVTTQSTVRCWGSNVSGEVGGGICHTMCPPTAVPGLP